MASSPILNEKYSNDCLMSPQWKIYRCKPESHAEVAKYIISHELIRDIYEINEYEIKLLQKSWYELKDGYWYNANWEKIWNDKIHLAITKILESSTASPEMAKDFLEKTWRLIYSTMAFAFSDTMDVMHNRAKKFVECLKLCNPHIEANWISEAQRLSLLKAFNVETTWQLKIS